MNRQAKPKAAAKQELPLHRWLSKARRVFRMRTHDYDEQSARAVDLARDIWRTLDPRDFKRGDA